MNRTFVLLLIAAVLLAFIFSADAVSVSKTKSKTAKPHTNSHTKSKSKAATKSKAKSISKSRTKTVAPVAPPVAPTTAPSSAPAAAPSSAPAAAVHGYTINLKLDATAAAANNARGLIETQLKEELQAASVTVGTFAHNKFTVQAVAASVDVNDAKVTASVAKAGMQATTYKLANFAVQSVDVTVPGSPSAAVRTVVGWGAVLSACLVAVSLLF